MLPGGRAYWSLLYLSSTCLWTNDAYLCCDSAANGACYCCTDCCVACSLLQVGVPGVENVNLSKIVSGHTDYLDHMADIIDSELTETCSCGTCCGYNLALLCRAVPACYDAVFMIQLLMPQSAV